MKVLAHEFLDEKADGNFKRIFNYGLIPWVINALANLGYFTTVLASDFKECSIAEEGVFEYCLSAIVLISSAYLAGIEFRQAKMQGLRIYATSLLNIMDVLTILLPSFIVLLNLSGTARSLAKQV